MPARTQISQMPDDIRAQLNNKLIYNNFSDYESLAQWLHDKGYLISRSTVGYYSRKFRIEIEDIKRNKEQTSALAEVLKDDQNDIGQTLIDLVKHKSFQALLNIDLDQEQEEGKIKFTELARLIAQISKSDIDLRKYREIIKDKAEKAIREVESLQKTKGLPADIAAQIRAQILGIA